MAAKANAQSPLQSLLHAAAFWRKDVKAAPTHQKKSSGSAYARIVSEYAYMSEPGKAVWMPRNYDKFAQEAYVNNVIAHRSIHMVASAAASIPFTLHYHEEGRTTELPDHPVLRLLSSPNPRLHGPEMIEALVAYRFINGNAYLLALSTQEDVVRELHILRPDRVAVVAGNCGMPSAYEYTVDGSTRRYPVNPITGQSAILHIKNFHPLSDWYGLSSIEAAAYSIDQHNHAGQWNQALLQHGAKPSGALMVKMRDDGTGGSLTDEQYGRIRHQIENEFAGAANAGRPLLLEGGLEWKEMSLSPKDMDFIESKHSSARDIALAFGVPPQLLGIPGDNTYSNLAEARLALWEQTVLPLMDNITAALNNWLIPSFGPNLKLSYETDKINALAPRRESIWAKLQNTDFMTINEKRKAVGLDPIEGADVLQLQQ